MPDQDPAAASRPFHTHDAPPAGQVDTPAAEHTAAPPGPASLARDAVLDLAAALGVSTVLVVTIAAVAVIGGFSKFADLQTTAPALIVFLLAVQVPLACFGWRRLRRNREKGRPAPVLWEGHTAAGILRGVGMGVLLAAVSALYSALVQAVLGPAYAPQQLAFLQQLLSDRKTVAVLTLIIAGLAPACEELFFRGAIFGSARALDHTRPGAAISAVLFATVHFSVALAPFYVFFALVMCWLLARTRTLAAPMAAHMTMNGLACLSVILLGSEY